MTDKQIAKQNMLQAVIRVLDENKAYYTHIPAFVKIVSDVKETMEEIKRDEDLQSDSSIKSATNVKDETKIQLVDQTVMIANALSAFASETNDVNLAPKVKVTKSMMYKSTDNEMLSIARRINAEAASYAGAISAYGISPETTASLETMAVHFESLIAAPRTAIAETKQTTMNLVRLFAFTDTLLNDRLDKLMSQFKHSASDFYAVYFNARNIINTAVRHRKTNLETEGEA